jgi:hypothetical protein
MMPLVQFSEYLIEGSGVTEEMVDAFLASSDVPAIRKTKSGEREIDIRPLADELRIEGDVLFARLMLTEKDTLKPDLLSATLAGEVCEDARIHRLSLLGRAQGGALQPIMRL